MLLLLLEDELLLQYLLLGVLLRLLKLQLALAIGLDLLAHLGDLLPLDALHLELELLTLSLLLLGSLLLGLLEKIFLLALEFDDTFL